jgi:putative DNA primase/helicase
VLAAVYLDFHSELLGLATGASNAYTYLRDDRGIHPQVIAEAMLGAVPSSYDVVPHFQPVIQDAHDAVTALQGKKGRRVARQLERAEQQLQDLQDAQQKLVACLAHHAGWLVFFYTDAAHQCVALRLREPYTKKFVSFKPGIAGVFGRELFTPFVSAANQALNEYLLVVEGEFNLLQLQSLTVRYEHATGQQLGYINACAVGSVSTADVMTIQRVASHPVICYDNDTNGAGFELVKRIQKAMPVEACTTLDPDSDLDSTIADFGHDVVGAWQAVQVVVGMRQPYGRIYGGDGEEFFDYPLYGRQRVFVPRLLGEALMARHTFRHTASLLWVYQNGVYLPCGERTLRADAQALLGKERREQRLWETLKYIEVATRLDADDSPDTRYINLRNGRLAWATGDLEPHTAAWFTTTQLPIDYDRDATCPTFDAYVRTTFDADVEPLIDEILGWCLVPEQRFEKSVMAVGEGKNGKSVFLDLVTAFLGPENVAGISLHELEENRFRVAELYGKLANVFADLDHRSLRSSTMFKTLTSGDRITGERKHRDPFAFRSYAKLLFSANAIPRSSDRSYAYHRRWLVLPFTRTFDGQGTNPAPDLMLRQKLLRELPGIFNRALTGLKRLYAANAFTEPQSVIDATQAYVRSNDHVRVFGEECVRAERDQSIIKKEFYSLYQHWCVSYGERPVGQRILGETLRHIFPGLDEYRENAYKPWCWLHIKWSPDAAHYKPPSLHVPP